MLPSRYVPGGGQSSAMRKSRLEGKPSMLPKPRRPGSTDRSSVEPRRSAAARSSSADPPRATFGARLSREASATKFPMSGRSRSQTADQRYGQTSMTPLRNSHYSRPTTTPQRTPSEDRAHRSWQSSLDRVLAFLTVKDQRPISNVAWQRAAFARVQEQLSARGGGDAVLIRPLTIARFVDIVSSLLNAIMKDAKLTTDNYVAKLPHTVKRLLYPGVVSKSWLKTVNTLHAFPHALALLAYLLDLHEHIEMPIQDDDEWLFVDKTEVGRLRRDYLRKCWFRFQDPDHQFEDLDEEYLQNLKALMGNDDERIMELQLVIKKYESCLEDEAEASARAHEARLVARRDNLHSVLRTERGLRRDTQMDTQAQHLHHKDMMENIKNITNEIHSAQAESQQLKLEIEQQTMTVAERTRLLDEVYYAAKVQDSKQALAEQIEKMLHSKELELAAWQQRSLDSCVQYKQGLIHLAADYPHLAPLAIDEKGLMEPSCASQVSSGAESLRSLCSELTLKKAARARSKSAHARQRQAVAEEARAEISELQSSISREQQLLEQQRAAESTEAASWSRKCEEMRARIEKSELSAAESERGAAESELWEETDLAWRTKLSAMHEAITKHKETYRRTLEAAREKREQIVAGIIKNWNNKLDEMEA